MNQLTAETFDQNARAALQDTQLRGALKNLADTFGERRKTAITTVENWEGLRDRARAIKDETLLHLDKYLAEFAENAEKAGARIHWARDGREACAIVLELLKERNASKVVKAKSMAAEEIHLNAALEKEGIIKSHIHILCSNEPGKLYWKNRGWIERKDIDVFSFISSNDVNA